jgi:hypothetical protein
MLDPRLLGDPVDRKGDLVMHTMRLDLDHAAPAVEHEGHRDHGLERVSLRAAGRPGIGFA